MDHAFVACMIGQIISKDCKPLIISKYMIVVHSVKE